MVRKSERLCSNCSRSYSLDGDLHCGASPQQYPTPHWATKAVRALVKHKNGKTTGLERNSRIDIRQAQQCQAFIVDDVDALNLGFRDGNDSLREE